MAKTNPVVHFEMPYEKPERVAKFYMDAFGWGMERLGPEMGNYVLAVTSETDEKRMVKKPGNINGGFFPKDPKRNATTPNIVIAVENLNESMNKVKKAGGRITSEPMDIMDVGTFAEFTDTEGNRVSMLQPKMK